MNLKATITDAAPYLLGKREMQKIGRDAIEAAGKYWHYKFKRRHFQLEAFDLYKYKTRTAKWEAIKKRIHPEAGGRPLVFSGESERLAMSSNRVDARAPSFDKYHADVTVSAPNLNFHSWEATKTTADEDAEMQAVFAQVFQDGVTAAWKSHGLSSAKIELGRQQLNAA